MTHVFPIRTRTRLLSATAAVFAMCAITSAQTPFPATEGFEPANDADTFIPTNSDATTSYAAPGYPGQVPGGQAPPLPLPDFEDIRNGWEGLIEEVVSGYNGVTSNTGSGHAVVYPWIDDSYQPLFKNGPFGRIGRQTAFPGGASAASWKMEVDIYAESVPSPGFLDYFWWTNAAGNNVDGLYLTETGFQIHPGALAWTFTTTAGGQPAANLPTGVWYHLEVVFERDPTNGSAPVVAHHRVYNADRTLLLYSHTLTSLFNSPLSSDIGGPRYTWFSVWKNDIVDHIYIDNLGATSGDAQVTLVATDTCLNASDNTLTVEVQMTGATQDVVGGQFFLAYDTSRLTLASAVPGDAPFTLQVYECSTDEQTGVPPAGSNPCAPGGTPGEIDYAVGVPLASSGTSADTVMARLTFNITPGASACNVADLVSFRTPTTPPSLLSNGSGQPVASTFSNLGSIVIDQVAPVIACPPNITANADAGVCTASFNTVVGNWIIGGGAQYVAQPNGNVAVQLTSDNPGPPTFSFAVHNLATPFTFQNLTDLSADYMMQSGCFNGGAPRFSVLVDFDNNGIISAGDKNVHVYWGSLPNYTDCPPLNTWLNSGDLADATDLRYDTGQVGGTFYDSRANANALVGSMLVLRINVPMDGQFAPGSQQMLLDNVNINGTVHTFNGATATDNCTASPIITAVRSDSPATLTDPYPIGITTITYTATDACGNSSQCQQTITVNANNTMVATVELKNVNTPMSRCITFDLFNGTTYVTTASTVVAFNDTTTVPGSIRGTATFDVACGAYTCITVRDKLHTLRRTVSSPEFQISGTQYVAEVTSDGANDDSLISGNMNDDRFIDILDFGAFSGQFNANYGTGNTLCGALPPNADFSGDGLVLANDYTFIANNFLLARETSCSGVLTDGDEDNGDGPITKISVKELFRRGLGHLAASDLNHDGWLDVLDMQIMLNGGGGNGGGAIRSRR